MPKQLFSLFKDSYYQFQLRYIEDHYFNFTIKDPHVYTYIATLKDEHLSDTGIPFMKLLFGVNNTSSNHRKSDFYSIEK